MMKRLLGSPVIDVAMVVKKCQEMPTKPEVSDPQTQPTRGRPVLPVNVHAQLTGKV